MRMNQLPAVIKREIPNAKMPIIYENAVRDLAACRSIDEALFFKNKSEALAVWAKIYKDGIASREARALKLHAYRRLGEIAHELRPKQLLKVRKRGRIRTTGCPSGLPPGPIALLCANGLSSNSANVASRMAKIGKLQFDKIVNSPKPPTPHFLAKHELKAGSESWRIFSSAFPGAPPAFRSFCRRNPAAAFAIGMTNDEAAKVRQMIPEMQDWLDTLEQHLPKEKKGRSDE